MDILKNTATMGANAPTSVPEMPETLEQEEQRRLRKQMRVYPKPRAKVLNTQVVTEKARAKAV
jgi:hypothetical protein